MATDPRYLGTGVATSSGAWYSHVTQPVASLVTRWVSDRPKTRLQLINEELEALRTRRDPAFRPTKRALRLTRFYVFTMYVRMGDDFPTPTFVLDGERGIITKWTQNSRTVRLNCLADWGDDYIYYENGEFDTEDEVTPDSLLNWLIQNEREPA